MNGPRDAAAAGLMIVVSMLLVAAIGYGLGSAVGATVPLAFAGLFGGLFLGLWIVYTRFKNL